MDKLVEMYEQGGITAAHLVASALCLIDPIDPGRVLLALPSDVLPLAHRYAEDYDQVTMRSNYGTIPAEVQIEAVRNWFGHRATLMQREKMNQV